MFHSFKKVLRQMQEKDAKYIQFLPISFHSTSKGLIGVCGQRGGYMEDAMYASPQIAMPKRAQSEALLRRIPADDFWCLELVEQTGIVCVPGSGFGQQEGTRTGRCIQPCGRVAPARWFVGSGAGPLPLCIHLPGGTQVASARLAQLPC